MNKIFLGALVGSIILFAWQSLSWTALGIHDNTFQYSPAQDTLIHVMEKNLSVPGQYLIPMPAEGTTEEEKESFRRSREGKPWAVVTYHSYYNLDMLGPLARGWLISLCCVLILCINIQQFQRIKFGRILLTSISYGLVGFLFISYNNHIWFSTPWTVLTGELIDSLMGWGLCGAWLGLWYSRK
jgi:hypothetical protein